MADPGGPNVDAAADAPDDPTILDEMRLLRVVLADQAPEESDGSGNRRASSQGICTQPDTERGIVAMSVYVEAILQEEGVEPERLVTEGRWRGRALVAFDAGTARGCTPPLAIARDPDDSDPVFGGAHAHILRQPGDPKRSFSGGQAKAIARAAVVVFHPG